MFCQVRGERDSRYVAKPKQSFPRAGPYLHAGIARERPQQWLIFANPQPPKTRGCYRTHTRIFVP
jgi:hypothetical protein